MEESAVCTCKRGDVFYVDLTKDMTLGSEQSGLRPVVVIQNNKGNAFSPTVIVAIITSKSKKNLPTHVPLVPSLPSVYGTICLEQIKTIDKSRLFSYRGNVGDIILQKIDKAIAASVGLDNSVSQSILDSTAKEEYSVEMINKKTSMDNSEIDWIEYAKQQMVFFAEVRQHIVNLSIEKDRLANEIESILSYIEIINLNVVQGYKVYHLLKEKRIALKKYRNEIEQLEIMISGFDCETMRRNYQSAVSRMQSVKTDKDVSDEIKALFESAVCCV